MFLAPKKDGVELGCMRDADTGSGDKEWVQSCCPRSQERAALEEETRWKVRSVLEARRGVELSD